MKRIAIPWTEVVSASLLAFHLGTGTLGAAPPREQAESSAETQPAADLADLPEPVRRAGSSIVRISTNAVHGSFTGTGFVVDPQGIVVTSHRVMQGARRAEATFSDGKTVQVSGCLQVSPEHDIAVLKLSGPVDDSNILPLANGLPDKETPAFALGISEKLQLLSSQGVVIDLRRSGHRGTWIETTASVSKHNQGGPLVSLDGEVIGMNCPSLTVGRKRRFAIAAAHIREVLRSAGDETPAIRFSDQTGVFVPISGLIRNGGFNVSEQTAGKWPQKAGDWSGDYSQIVPGSPKVVVPYEGSGMLQFVATKLPGGKNDGTGSQVYQLVDLRPYRSAIAEGNVMASASARFNRVAGGQTTDNRFILQIIALRKASRTAADRFRFSPNATRPNRLLSQSRAHILTDGVPRTWEKTHAKLLLPRETDYIAIGVSAVENVRNERRGEFHGHFADDVRALLYHRDDKKTASILKN